MKRYYLERAAYWTKYAKLANSATAWLLRIRAATMLAKANGYNGAKPC